MALQLTGLSEQSISHIVFLDDVHLAATSGTTLTLYDLTQASPLTISQPGQVPDACTACPGTAVFPSPDGAKVAFMDDAGPVNSLVIHDVRSGREVTYEERSAASGATLGPPTWSPNGVFLLIPRAVDGSDDVLSADTLERVRLRPAGGHAETIVSSRFVDGGRQFVTVAKDGRVTVRERDDRRDSADHVAVAAHRRGRQCAATVGQREFDRVPPHIPQCQGRVYRRPGPRDRNATAHEIRTVRGLRQRGRRQPRPGVRDIRRLRRRHTAGRRLAGR